ncbi:hypothetical protein D3C87_142950 [compost metagenome]
MKTKLFTRVTTLSIAVTFVALLLGLIGAAMSSFYPGLAILIVMALITIYSRLYATRISVRSNDFQRNYYTIFTIINVLLILIALWMTFVIVHDRVLGDC